MDGRVNRPCLGFIGSCPNMATRDGRCDDCRRRREAQRNQRCNRRIYNAKWRATSEKARQDQPWCSVCYKPKSTEDPLSVDHTTGLVLCRQHHPTEANGGVRGIKKGPAVHSRGRERFGSC
jgi:hypothetical protein